MSEIFKRGQKLSDIKASELQKLVETSREFNTRFTVSPPLKILKAHGGGVHLTWEADEGFWAKITSQDSTTGACAWTEQVPKEDGQFEDRIDGRTGTTTSSPAYEVNGSKSLTLPMYVWLLGGWQHTSADSKGITGREWLFEATAAGGAWVHVDSTTSKTIYLGRSFTDGQITAGSTSLYSAAKANFTSADVGMVVAGVGIQEQRSVSDGSTTISSTTLTSNTAGFTSLDVGLALSGAGIPANTTISSVTNGTTVVMSNAATATATKVSVTIGTPTKISSVTDANNATMSQPALSTVNPATIAISTAQCTGYSATTRIPTAGSCGFSSGVSVWFQEVNGRTPASEIYQCRPLGSDAFGTAIWATRFYVPCATNLQLGPFITSFSCDASGQVTYTSQYLCIPKGDICSAFLSSDGSQCVFSN